MTDEKEFDIVVFGASGFTGQYVTEEVYRQLLNEPGIKFAVAGRNKEKMEKLLQDSATQCNYPDLVNTPIIVASTNDDDSLLQMARKAKVVLNCTGPYYKLGEQVIKACLEGGAHHLDISGELNFLEGTQVKYFNEAKEKSVYVIGSLGFDSVAADMGVMHVAENFDGELNSVESYMKIKPGPDGSKGHFTSYECAVNISATRNELRALRNKLYPEKLTKPEFPVGVQNQSWFEPMHSWAVPFPGPDKAVVYRSQRYLHETTGSRLIQYNPYVCLGSSRLNVMGFGVFGSIFFPLSKTSFGRSLLLKYPSFFTMGTMTHEGPTRKMINEDGFEMRFIGKGWRTPQKVQTTPPDSEIVTSLKSGNIGYLACSIYLVSAALTILKEPQTLPLRGGVFSPAAAFAKSNYLKRIQYDGRVKFDVLSKT